MMADPQPDSSIPAQRASPPTDPKADAAQADRAAVGEVRADENPTRTAVREAVEKLQQALPALHNADRSLAERVEQITGQAADPLRVNQHTFQHGVAYAAQDAGKALGASTLGFSHATKAEMERLSATAPGLVNERAQRLLQNIPALDDRALARDIRRAGTEIGQQADQNTPAIRSRLEVLENRLRLAPRIDTPEPSAPQSRPAAETRTTQTAAAADQTGQRPRDQRPGSLGSEINVPQTHFLNAFRGRGQTSPPWEATPEPFSARLHAFEARMAEGRDEQTLRAAEKSGRAAMNAMEGFRIGEGAVVVNRIREAASHDPDGMAGVLSEMREGGRYADLRRQFGNALADEKGITAAYDKAAAALGQYGEDRKPVEQVIARRPDAANLSAKFERLDQEIGQAAGALPSRRDGKTMLDDLSKQVAEMLQRAVENIRQMVSRDVSAGPARSGPSPG